MIKKVIFSNLNPDYIVVASDLNILKKDEVLVKDGQYYVNSDESIFIKSTNDTGRIIKKVSKCADK